MPGLVQNDMLGILMITCILCDISHEKKKYAPMTAFKIKAPLHKNAQRPLGPRAANVIHRNNSSKQIQKIK